MSKRHVSCADNYVNKHIHVCGVAFRRIGIELTLPGSLLAVGRLGRTDCKVRRRDPCYNAESPRMDISIDIPLIGGMLHGQTVIHCDASVCMHVVIPDRHRAKFPML